MRFYDWPKLYCIDQKDKVRTYSLSVRGDDKAATISYEAGLLNGKQVPYSKLVNKGKNIGKSNETTPIEQAYNEADSMWNDKLKEGYKSLEQLGIIVIDNKYIVRKGKRSSQYDATYTINQEENAVKDGIGFYNTNQDWNEMCMLANKYKADKFKFGQHPILFVQPKLNGVRCIAKKVGTEVILMSRGGIYYEIPHLKRQLEYLLGDGVVFDGEIYVHGRSLQDISGAVRKQESGLFTSNSWLEYHVYDVAVNATQDFRLSFLRENKDVIEAQPSISVVDTVILNYPNAQKIKELHDLYTSNGYEGAMIRIPSARYEFGFRSSSLLKVKEYIDEEFIILDYQYDPGVGIDSFVFVLKNNKDSQTFKARPSGTREQKQFWLNHPHTWKDKKATVRFQERSDTNLPIQGHVKHTKTACLVEVIRDYE